MTSKATQPAPSAPIHPEGPDHTADLRAVYLFVYDTFATNPSEVVGIAGVDNVRYARELLGTLTHAGLVAVDQSDETEDAWQTVPTYDKMTRGEAQDKIDAFLYPSKSEQKVVKAQRAKPKRDSNPADLPLCGCGCGTPIGRKSRYSAGHDARHAGDVAREIADRRSVAPDQDVSDLLAPLSGPLSAKAMNMAERLLAKRNATPAKPAPAPAPTPKTRPVTRKSRGKVAKKVA